MTKDTSTAPGDGTEDTAPENTGTPDTSSQDTTPDQPNPLLDELKQERRQRKALESRLADLERAADEARQAALPEQERMVEQARRAGRDEALAEVRQTLARAKVHATAASLGFQDPADAAAHLDLAALDPEDDAAMAAAVRTLAESKPYLLGRTPPAAPKVPGGPQGGEAPKPTFNQFLQSAVRGGRG